MQKDSANAPSGPLARGVAQSGVRIANERTVLTLIAMNPGASNAEIARWSGLGPQTTSRIVSELETRAMVLRGEVLRGRRGQPATPLFLNPESAYTFGVEIGWRHREVLLLEMSGRTLGSIRHSHDWPDIQTIFDDIAADIAQLRATMAPWQIDRLAGIGLASPSQIERNIVRMGAPGAHVPLWHNLDLAAVLTRQTGLETDWYNDGSAACWSELTALPSPRPTSFAYFQVGVFLAAGIVVNAELWDTPGGNVANLGAMLVTGSDGAPTYLFQMASLLALQSMLEKAGLKLPSGNALDWDWDALEPVASAWIDCAANGLAQAVISTRAVIDFDLAIVDGVMPRFIVEQLFDRLAARLAAMPLSSIARPAIAIGHLGAGAAATGAAERLLFARFFSRQWNIFST